MGLLEWLLAAGPVRLVTLAPEVPGAESLIRSLLGHEIAISCGHSDATAEEANTAFDAGAQTVSHLVNAMGPFHKPRPWYPPACSASPMPGASPSTYPPTSSSGNDELKVGRVLVGGTDQIVL